MMSWCLVPTILRWWSKDGSERHGFRADYDDSTNDGEDMNDTLERVTMAPNELACDCESRFELMMNW